MRVSLIFLASALSLFSCKESADISELRNEIFNTEKAFEKMVADSGISYAFAYYADENAVIKRDPDTLIIGRNGIRHYYQNKNLNNAKVNWKPDFIHISASGDLAYTYGKYVWQITNDKDSIIEFKGIFHTVWKRQKDKSWKYVWD
jgi:ketosteroid isomerase-like protein